MVGVLLDEFMDVVLGGFMSVCGRDFRAGGGGAGAGDGPRAEAELLVARGPFFGGTAGGRLAGQIPLTFPISQDR